MEINEDIYSWELHAQHIKILRESKKNGIDEISYQTSINSSQILMTAVLVESVICYVLIYLVSRFGSLFPEGMEKSDYESRIQKDLKKRIQKSSWGQLDDIFHLVTGSSLKSISPEKWEAVGVLFIIRNMLSHGEFIKVIYKLEIVECPPKAKSMEIYGRKKLQITCYTKTSLIWIAQKGPIVKYSVILSQITSYLNR